MTFDGGVVFVELLSPGFDDGCAGAAVFGDVLDGVLGVALESAGPEGELGELIDPVVPVGVLDASGGVVVVDPPLIELDVDGVDEGDASLLGAEPTEPVVAVLPVVDVVDGLDIVLSVFGVSVLLQAPSAASAAATATHFIERCMFSPRWWGVARVPSLARIARR